MRSARQLRSSLRLHAPFLLCSRRAPHLSLAAEELLTDPSGQSPEEQEVATITLGAQDEEQSRKHGERHEEAEDDGHEHEDAKDVVESEGGCDQEERGQERSGGTANDADAPM